MDVGECTLHSPPKYRQSIWILLPVNNFCFSFLFTEMVKGEPMFVFNLTSISTSEHVFSGDIHVYRKRPKSPDHQSNAHAHAHMILHHVAPGNYLTHIASLLMSDAKFGWQSYDVTSAVQNCLQKSRDHQRVAISFASGRVKTGDNSLPLKHFIRHNVALPFLIVFSNDTQNITLDHIDPHFAVKGPQDVIIDPEFGVEVPLFGKKRRKSSRGHRKASVSRETASRMSSEVEDEGIEQDDESAEEVPELVVHRGRRSIYDNEIPEHPTDAVEPDAPYNVPRTHPGILKGRGQSVVASPPTSADVIRETLTVPGRVRQRWWWRRRRRLWRVLQEAKEEGKTQKSQEEERSRAKSKKQEQRGSHSTLPSWVGERNSPSGEHHPGGQPGLPVW